MIENYPNREPYEYPDLENPTDEELHLHYEFAILQGKIPFITFEEFKQRTLEKQQKQNPESGELDSL